MARKTTYKRRPNNSGTVVKLSGKRRKPYCARVLSNDRDLITPKYLFSYSYFWFNKFSV